MGPGSGLDRQRCGDSCVGHMTRIMRALPFITGSCTPQALAVKGQGHTGNVAEAGRNHKHWIVVIWRIDRRPQARIRPLVRCRRRSRGSPRTPPTAARDCCGGRSCPVLCGRCGTDRNQAAPRRESQQTWRSPSHDLRAGSRRLFFVERMRARTATK